MSVTVKPDSVTLTNVVPLSRGANVHSTVVGPLYPGHSMTIRRFGSITLAVTWIETSYISQSHRIDGPTASRPLLRVNENCVVISGFTIASNTSATGFRTSIPVSVIGTRVS